jgi:hypothetical protein
MRVARGAFGVLACTVRRVRRIASGTRVERSEVRCGGQDGPGMVERRFESAEAKRVDGGAARIKRNENRKAGCSERGRSTEGAMERALSAR